MTAVLWHASQARAHPEAGNVTPASDHRARPDGARRCQRTQMVMVEPRGALSPP
ncbi:hypothetical protein GCM10009757_07160 [Streptomyces cheonanensis]|uniref:Uncharacterized protein n=1 Tax=Streptomyces cheonanensis TaxID=312720 RepID=A0ABN2UUF0_9ACTN